MVKKITNSGSDVSAGTFRCTSCGYKLSIQSKKHIPPCPICANGQWEVLTGVGDAVKDPYPNKKKY